MFLEIILIVLLLVICPCLIGNFYVFIVNMQEDFNQPIKYVVGNIIMWAIFEMIAVPCILLKTTLTVVQCIWLVMIVTISIGGIVLIIKNKAGVLAGGTKFYHKVKQVKEKGLLGILIVIIITLVGFQIYQYVFHMHIDNDDSRFIVSACDAYETNQMLQVDPSTGQFVTDAVIKRDVVSPWMIYVAMLSKLTRIYPTILAHTILPVFLILMIYFIFWSMGGLLFKGNILSMAMFMCFIAWGNIYFNVSIYTQATFMLIRIWQGKAIVAALIIPFISLLLYYTYVLKNKKGSYILLFIANIAGCLLSGAGVFLCPILTGTYGIVYSIFKKRYQYIIIYLACCIPEILCGVLNIILN